MTTWTSENASNLQFIVWNMSKYILRCADIYSRSVPACGHTSGDTHTHTQTQTHTHIVHTGKMTDCTSVYYSVVFHHTQEKKIESQSHTNTHKQVQYVRLSNHDDTLNRISWRLKNTHIHINTDIHRKEAKCRLCYIIAHKHTHTHGGTQYCVDNGWGFHHQTQPEV